MTAESPTGRPIESRSDQAPRGDADAPSDPLDNPRAAQFLSIEHSSLLATRSMSWNEAFSRTSMFLSTLSAATVALALVGPATSFGPAFVTFALVILSITLFLGVATFVRLSQVNNEDLYWVYGMNRLRGAYVRLVPGIEDHFVAGHTVDGSGISRTFAAVDLVRNISPLHLLVTTPAVVGVISGAIAGAIAGLVGMQLGLGTERAVGLGLAVLVGAIALFVAYAYRDSSRYIARVLRMEADRTGLANSPGGAPDR